MHCYMIHEKKIAKSLPKAIDVIKKIKNQNVVITEDRTDDGRCSSWF